MSNTSPSQGAERVEMQTSTARRLSRTAAEDLLDGNARPQPLSQLLAAARGPAMASELAGEAAARAAFAAAATTPSLASHAPRRPSPLKTSLATLLTAKALVAVTVTTTAGGVALAAATGSLPMISPPAAHPAAPAGPSQDATGPGPALPAEGPGMAVHPLTAPLMPETSQVNAPPSVSSPSPPDLCQIWLLRMGSASGIATSYCSTPEDEPSLAPKNTSPAGSGRGETTDTTGETPHSTESPSTSLPTAGPEPQEPEIPEAPPAPDQPDRPVTDRIVDHIRGLPPS